jgi:hypothetical protein
MKNRKLLGLFSLTAISLISTSLYASPAIPPVAPKGPTPCTNCYNPPIGLKWNYVLSVAPTIMSGIGIYDFDGFDNSASVVASFHAAGDKAICYIDAGTWENWRSDAGEFPASVLGDNNGWPGERWLDIRQIPILAPIMTARAEMCKSKGFDAIEFDNVDGYANPPTGFPLTAEDQIAYDTFLANLAHSVGLSVALKNDTDQVNTLLPYFDFSINEQCFQYDECNTETPFISANKAVFEVEYSLKPAKFCAKAIALKFSSIKKNINLTNPVTECT